MRGGNDRGQEEVKGAIRELKEEGMGEGCEVLGKEEKEKESNRKAIRGQNEKGCKVRRGTKRTERTRSLCERKEKRG